MLLHRILAVNIFALAILAGSLFYLDGFRSRLTESATLNAETQAQTIADAMRVAELQEQPWLIRRLGLDTRTRLRVYRNDGSLWMDSWNGARPTYELRDPAREPFRKDIARLLDNAFDAIVGAPASPDLVLPAKDELAAWPEAGESLRAQRTTTMLRRAPEGTPYISAAAPVGKDSVLLLTRNARDIRAVVRDERLTLGIVLSAVIIVSITLSLFLARTIARPLRRLARAAHRVRLGRAREVAVPLLPERRDEIGLLARALHDMTQSLRQRIDATEAFAADVTHELKNPLASLRSAVDTLDRVKDPDLQRQLLDVVHHDIARLDRLIVEIAEISRLDAELSRARFEPVDLGTVIESMLPHWEKRAAEHKVRIAFARPGSGTAVISGDEQRLARTIDNVVDNAISFSPRGGLVQVGAVEIDDQIFVTVEDEGPGVPPAKREKIFDRFHSDRPEEEEFGRHSGLGLAIVRATVEGHGGRIHAEDRQGGRSGARFVIRFPAAAAS
ncbi:sensor histidine kinase [Allosphingosinicella deserti]|uniref:histidine kinase n=1 Tax=Allosphingosinicella deserti TaxID=2116704 RepID=A0A2P7QPJ8_9SPHN|nr:ATP-binding protein [Sphingomonas deserti]PSJ39881.1 sensor histidine kinase [Sphingomonas deserti]